MKLFELMRNSPEIESRFSISANQPQLFRDGNEIKPATDSIPGLFLSSSIYASWNCGIVLSV
jgi:hypothetical protein